VSQDASRAFFLDGVDETAEASYQVEPVHALINYFASPAIDVRVVVEAFDDKRYVVIGIPPFERTPVVCRANTPDGVRGNDRMHRGDFYVRTGSPIAVQKVQNAEMMHELLELAAGHRTAETLRVLRAGGVSLDQVSPPDRYAEEVSDLADYL